MCATPAESRPPASDNKEKLSKKNMMDDGKQPKKSDISDAPIVLRPWVFIYRSVPQIVPLPFIGDITLSLFFGGLLHLIRIYATPIMIDVYGWPQGYRETNEAVGAVVSMVHAALLLPSLFVCLLTQPYRPSALMSSAPLWWQHASACLIHLCTGYMLQDSFFTFILESYTPGKGLYIQPADRVFIAHHFVTVSYMLSCLKCGAGHISAMILMYMGEFTNPVFNSFLMSKYALRLGCCGATIEMHQILAFTYAVLYIFFRVVTGPIAAVHLVYDLLLTKHGRANIPIALSIYYGICAFGILAGSIPWSFEAIEICKAFIEGRQIDP